MLNVIKLNEKGEILLTLSLGQFLAHIQVAKSSHDQINFIL